MKLALPLLALGILLFAFGCEEVTDGQKPADLFADPLENLPVEYGRLVSVTTLEVYPNWYQLWFEDESGTIRLVRVRLPGGMVHREILTIPRTAPPAAEATEEG